MKKRQKKTWVLVGLLLLSVLVSLLGANKYAEAQTSKFNISEQRCEKSVQDGGYGGKAVALTSYFSGEINIRCIMPSGGMLAFPYGDDKGVRFVFVKMSTMTGDLRVEPWYVYGEKSCTEDFKGHVVSQHLDDVAGSAPSNRCVIPGFAFRPLIPELSQVVNGDRVTVFGPPPTEGSQAG